MTRSSFPAATARAALVGALLATGAACRASDRTDEAFADSAAASAAAGSSAAPDVSASPGDASPMPGALAITSQSGEIVLSLAADTVFMNLSDSLQAQVRAETDSATMTEPAGSFGGKIERMVKSNVQRALATRIKVPLSEIEDVRLEGDAIRFDYRGRKPMLSFESVKMGKENRPVLESFSRPDAERFVAAVRAAKRGR